ncbi:fungal-specific transcription factor domain-containing protein [Crucibulum laeve]|uniref:Fungal-specific transcription factor domain-containing protein n=1 Tax=Crucibulum laeve TaxID=68775 RepID=A0A5C3LI52_9AGAR|nr:fungal-specific transcription factor domain-containing protein [Crucibulum laeve]
MEHFDPRNLLPHPSSAPFASSFHTSTHPTTHSANHYPPPEPLRTEPPRVAFIHDSPHHEDKQESNAAFMKGPKRKRLAKACDACHKSKRRCDGTAPCSNCYYATKQCTYTDASGRPVPAPRTGKPERVELPPPSDNRPPSYSTSQQQQQNPHFPSADPSARFPHNPRVTANYPSNPGPSSSGDISEDERLSSRKRFRNEKGNAVAAEDLIIDGPIPGVTLDRPTPVGLDPSLTRELTNLFFTHCNPARAIVHKPAFAAALSHNGVPDYLLHAVCALAAPLSKQPRIRTTPSRFAGKPFAQEALSIMFDGAGRLKAEKTLATAQALCLLQMHDHLTRDANAMWSSRYHDLALAILDTLGVHSPEHPTLTPVPSPEFIQASIEREAVRRIFWLIHMLDVMDSIYFKKPITFSGQDLRLRLPVDETSFELGVHSTLPEYLYLPAVRMQYSSEMGHLIRILTVYAKVEVALDDLNDPATIRNPTAVLMDAEKEMEDWANTLSDHLRFSEESLLVQQSMFETSSNTGAWCWCFMHVYHASCVLALNFAKQRTQRGQPINADWALQTLDLILNMLGDRAKNSMLLGAALWSLIKYCKRDDPQVRQWCADYEDCWGIKMFDITQEWRPQPSPPQQHPYPSQMPVGLQQHQLQEAQQQSSLAQPPASTHRRLSEARNPNTNNPPNLGPRPPPQQHGVDANRRSSSSSPTSYPLGRSLDELRLHNNNNSNRSPPSHVPHPDSTRDLLAGSALAGTNGVGPTHGHGGSDKYSSYNERSEKENGINGAMAVNGVGHPNGGGASVGAAAGAPGNGSAGQRNHTAGPGDGPQSLPSLKASGLLDSWTSSRAEVQKQQIHGNNGAQRSSPRRSPPTIPPSHVPHDMDVRSSATIGMPVGLQWLANESR